jgi:hypothetical protein
MKKLLTLILSVASFAASAASYVTVTNSFTNRTVSGDNFTAAGVTVRFTNTPLNSQTWIVTNSAKASATNLWRFLGRTQPALYVRMANETNVVISGNDLQFSISGGYSVLTTNSSLATNQTAVTIPWTVLTPANQTNQADELLRGLSGYSYSNTFAADSHALTNFVGKTNAATLTRKTLTAPVLNTPTNFGGIYSNAMAVDVTNLYAQAAQIGGGSVSNVYVLNAAAMSGILTALTNGGLFGATVTNAPWLNATNAKMATVRIDTLVVWNGLTVTNLNSPGTGADSQAVGASSVASGQYAVAYGAFSSANDDNTVAIGSGSLADFAESVAVGYNSLAQGHRTVSLGAGSEADGTNSTAIGYASVATHNYSTAIGYSATTTTTNQVRLGTAAETVSVPGILSVESGISNSVTTGTNKFNARLDFTSRAVSSLVNGANSGIVLGSNVFVKLSGGSTVCALSGFQAAQDGTFHILHITGGITNVIVNEVNSTDYATDATAANRIVTGTGTNFYSTNSPLVLPVIYDAAASRWKIVSFMR